MGQKDFGGGIGSCARVAVAGSSLALEGLLGRA